MQTYVAYTDGSCHPNPDGFGGWGYVINATGETGWDARYGGVPGTTTNRMEMQAAIETLKIVPEGDRVLIHSDSRYLVDTMVKGWNRGANNDLWKEIDVLCESRDVDWIWVKGHDGNIRNEMADRLANKGRLELTKETDETNES